MISPTSRTQEPARIVPGRTILYAGCLLACLVGREKVLCPAGESCHLTHALEILASLPRDEGALAGSASYVLYNVDLYLQEGSTQSTKACASLCSTFSHFPSSGSAFSSQAYIPYMQSLNQQSSFFASNSSLSLQVVVFRQEQEEQNGPMPPEMMRKAMNCGVSHINIVEFDLVVKLQGQSSVERYFFLNVVTIGWSRMPHNCACKCGLAGRPGCSKSPKI